MNIIRWILIIPAYAIAASFILKVFLPLLPVAERLGGKMLGNRLKSLVTIVAYFFYGFIPVAVGCWIAPSYKLIVAILLTLYCIVEALRRSYIFSHFTKSAYSNTAATIIGALIAASNFIDT